MRCFNNFDFNNRHILSPSTDAAISSPRKSSPGAFSIKGSLPDQADNVDQDSGAREIQILQIGLNYPVRISDCRNKMRISRIM